jgi:hypothetical protein
VLKSVAESKTKEAKESGTKSNIEGANGIAFCEEKIKSKVGVVVRQIKKARWAFWCYQNKKIIKKIPKRTEYITSFATCQN